MPFASGAWSKPGGELTPEQYCSVCLIDYNPSGAKKKKELCKLPIRKKPGGPIYKAAIRNAAGRIFQMQGVPADKKRAAARRLVRLGGEAGVEIGPSVRKLAGMKAK